MKKKKRKDKRQKKKRKKGKKEKEKRDTKQAAGVPGDQVQRLPSRVQASEVGYLTPYWVSIRICHYLRRYKFEII